MTVHVRRLQGPASAVLLPRDLARELESLVAEHRRSLGLSTVHRHRVLIGAAARHCERMRRLGFVDHHDPWDGSDPYDRVRSGEQRSWAVIAENIAAGQSSARQVLDHWVASAGHRANLERPGLNAIGTAVVTGGALRTYTTQVYGIEYGVALTTPVSR